MNLKFKDVVAYFGSILELAESLGVKREAIYQWEKIPVLRCYELEKLSLGKFKADDLLKLKLKDSPTAPNKPRRATSHTNG